MVESKTKYQPFLIFFLLIAFLFAAAVLVQRRAESPRGPLLVEEAPALRVPDFNAIQDVDARKLRFFDFLQPYVDAENRKIMAQRSELLRLEGKIAEGLSLTRKEKAFVSAISEEYEIDTIDQSSPDHFRQLLRRVDIIPSSLVLAQAANESAWGTSRFAIEGNNFFGEWCYTEGCGLVPERRHSDASHEVRAFGDVAESVRSYFMNINTFPSYLKLRRIRETLRDQGKAIDGLSLSEGLDSYSERGAEYIEELQSMINFNELHRRDGSHKTSGPA